MKLLGVKQLSEFLGVPITWIYDRTRKSGPEQIPHIKFGKYVRFNHESDVFQQWVAGHSVGLNTQQHSQTLGTKSSK